MRLKPISAKQAEKITKKLGLCWGDGQRTFYATDEEETEVWEYDSKAERNKAVKRDC